MTPANLPIEKRAKILERLPLAREMVWSDVETLARYLDPFRVEKNETLFMEGENKPFLLIVLKGTIRVFKEDGMGGFQVLNEVKVGKMLGEMSLVDGAPRSASAVASEETIVLRLTGENFSRIQDKEPHLALQVFAQIARILSQRLRQTSGSLVEHMHHGGKVEEGGEPFLGEETMLGIAMPRAAPSRPEPAPPPPQVDEGDDDALPADLAMRRYLLPPGKPADPEEVVRAINLMHKRLIKLERWMQLQRIAAGEGGRPREEKPGEGFLKQLFR